MRDMEGKLALVTGGAKGVGRVIATRLAERGARVLINFFHSLEASKATCAEIRARGGQAEPLRGSVARREQVERMFDEIRQRHGGLDILINNAASGAMVPTAQVTEEYFDRALDTNLKGAFWCSQRAVPLMQKRGGGVIVNVSSLGAQLPVDNYLVVGTSKAALESLTRYLAAEYAPLNIRVNAASAGMLDTEVIRNFPNYEELRRSLESASPLGRIGTAEELADVVLFLASEQSRWIVGQTVVADGGLSVARGSLAPPVPAERPAESPPQTPSARALVTEGSSEDIAVVGMGVVLAGAQDVESYWKALLEGRNLFQPVPADRWNLAAFYAEDPSAEDKGYCLHSAFITEPVPSTGLPPGEHDFTVHWLRHSLADALRGVKRRPEDRHAFITGYTADGSQFLEESLLVQSTLQRLERLMARRPGDKALHSRWLAAAREALHAGYAHGRSSPARFLPHRVGQDTVRGLLPEHTEILMVDTACSSSLYAVDIGMKALRMGKQDVVVCGGAMSLAPMNGVLFSKFRGLSASGEARPLDSTCDGVLFADGAGVVVLKRLERALEDGDPILAVLSAFGASSDGKGKAIYAPSSAGQNLALRRAMAHPAYQVRHLDFIVAHATGTPTGDKTEIQALNETLPPGRTHLLSSNKSIIGHTGWAAGVTSLIEAILALRKELIPPQHRFTRPVAELERERSVLVIPRQPSPWPARPDAPRLAAVSSFGFGGTNAHLLVSDFQPGRAPSPPARTRPLTAPLALVAWAARMPGLDAPEQVQQWVKGQGPEPSASFGESYPLPPFEKIRMSQRTARTIDRCQLMVLECAHQLKQHLGRFWEDRLETAGVFLGHMGKTQQALRYSSRCYLDDLQRVLREAPALREEEGFSAVLEELSAEVKRLVPTSNEDSFPGLMPNVIPARIANFFDLRGPTMAVDTGLSSALSALEVAARYLRSGEVDLALVGGTNGNSGPEADTLLRELVGSEGQRAAEACVLFALVREEDALKAGLPILARVGEPGELPAQRSPSLLCGVRPEGPNYLGADAAVALLRALPLASESPHVRCVDETGRAFTLPLHPPEAQAARAAAPVPARFHDARSYAPGQPVTVRRQKMGLKPLPDLTVRQPLPFFPPGTLLLTDQPGLLESPGLLPPDVIVLSTAPLRQGPRRFFLPRVTEEAVETVLRPLRDGVRHLRVLSHLAAAAPLELPPWHEPEALIALNDLLFLTLKQVIGALRQPESSFVSLFTGALAGEVPQPLAGLFSGLINCAHFELRPCETFAVFTREQDVPRAVREAERESSLKRFTATVIHDGGTRKAVLATEEDAPLPADAPARLSEDSVVVATGGARGITAEVVKALALHHRPHLYLIGSNALDSYPAALFQGSDEDFEKQRSRFILEQRTAHPEKSVKQINAEFDRRVSARWSQRTLEELRQLCGPGKVHYFACNVLDREGLEAAVGQVVRRHGHIDLVINAAGLDKSQSIEKKTFEDFLYIRELKRKGYQNLKYAVRHAPPRLWCNFGSVVSGLGQAGQVDYAAGNTLLNTAASYAASRGEEEFTVGWTVWGYSGMITTHYYRSIAGVVHSSGLFTLMTNEEGVHHFMRELHLPRHEPVTLHLGTAEKRVFAADGDFLRPLMPQLFPSPAARPPGYGRFYIEGSRQVAEGELELKRTFELERDAYLKHHLVNGHPTLPGTFVPELAAEASEALVPGMQAVAFEDIVFHHFLRVYGEGTPAPKRIRARLLSRDEERAEVEVRVLTDVVAPNGTVLRRDRLHFEARVILQSRPPHAPLWEAWPALGEVPVPDPYHLPAAPVLLTDLFVSTTGTRMHPLGKRATWKASVPPEHPVFSRFITPSILIDGLARVAVLGLVEGYVPLAAPARIRRLELYEHVNDAELAARGERLELYATPRDIGAFGANSPHNRCVAVRPDGRVLVQIHGLVGIVMGYVHLQSGEFVSASEVEERLKRSGSAPEVLPAAAPSAGSAPASHAPARAAGGGG